MNEHKEVTPNKCQSIYRNALDALQIAHTTADPLHSVGYLRALYQTQRCDHVGTNLDAQRKDVAVALKLGPLRRLVEQCGGATQEDYIEAHHAVRHYAPSHRNGLKAALTSTWPQWIEFHATAGLEQTAAVVSAVGGVFGFGHSPKHTSTWRQYVKPAPGPAPVVSSPSDQ